MPIQSDSITSFSDVPPSTPEIADTHEGPIPVLLRAARHYVGMDIAFISEFVGDLRIFRYVDKETHIQTVKAELSDPREESYCALIVDGRLPSIIQDTDKNPIARQLAVTARLNIGAYIGVPITLRDGTVYGTFCCYSTQTNYALGERDLEVMRMLAEIMASYVEKDVAEARGKDRKRQRIQAVIDDNQLSMAYQPIVNINTGQFVGFESLSRFNTEPKRGPDIWYAEAADVGMDAVLECRAIALALADLGEIPSNCYLSFNVSSSVVLSGHLTEVLAGIPLDRLVVEITEHTVIGDYENLVQALVPFRERGLRLAVDDAGAGYASLRHILYLDPDVIKLDMSLTRHIDIDKDRQALASALTHFAKATGSEIVAEGVETEPELNTLMTLGVSKAQGYYLARPAPIADIKYPL